MRARLLFMPVPATSPLLDGCADRESCEILTRPLGSQARQVSLSCQATPVFSVCRPLVSVCRPIENKCKGRAPRLVLLKFC